MDFFNDLVFSFCTWLSFERSYEVLKQTERTLNATSAKTINECMRAPNDTLTRHNFFTNKFDTTAWYLLIIYLSTLKCVLYDRLYSDIVYFLCCATCVVGMTLMPSPGQSPPLDWMIIMGRETD